MAPLKALENTLRMRDHSQAFEEIVRLNGKNFVHVCAGDLTCGTTGGTEDNRFL